MWVTHDTAMAEDRWRGLGALLIQRRTALDPRYHNRTAFAEATGLNYRVIYDIEEARRTNFGNSTIAAIEVAYQLHPGSIARYLDGGELADTPPEPEAQVIPFPGGVDDAIRRTLAVQRILGITIDPADEAVQELLRLPLSPEQAAVEVRKLFKFRAEHSAGGLGTSRRERR